MTNVDPENHSKLIEGVDSYFKSKDYLRSIHVRDKVFKIPETNFHFGDIDYSSGIRKANERSKSEIKKRPFN